MDTSKRQVAQYLRDFSRQLQQQAQAMGFETTTYLLGLVVADMTTVIDAKQKMPKRAAG
jgi:hypothetical protein